MGGTEVDQKKLLHDLRKVQFLQLEVSVQRSKYSRGCDLRLEQSSLVDLTVSLTTFLCCSAGLELLRPLWCVRWEEGEVCLTMDLFSNKLYSLDFAQYFQDIQ